MGKRGAKRSKSKAKAREPKPSKKKATGGRRVKARARKRAPVARRREGGEARGRTADLVRDLAERHETGPAASAGDLDADWQRAQSSGEEAVGGSVATPDQDVVDDIGHALGVEQPMQAPLRTSEEILEDRDQRYWDFERRAARKAVERREP